jgi:hypothetical protein
VFKHAITILEFVDCVIVPAVCVHEYVALAAIVNVTDVAVIFTDPAPVLLNERFFICKDGVTVPDIVLSKIPENSR